VYLGLTLAVQYYVVYRRALPLWAQLGPDAGRPLQVRFSQGPGGFFATFRGPGAAPGAPGGPGGWAEPGGGWVRPGGGAAVRHDPTVIDAEVVEDEQDPPELSAPG
jgi:hypothetical protein